MAVVVIGNDPTCGPDMAHDWHETVDGGGTLPCTVPSDGREGRDRESLTLAQEQLVKQVYAVNPKTVVILVSSFPFAINWSQAHVPAILHMTHASQDEGTALAKVLFGDYNPGGHLTTTWPKSLDQLPPMMDYNIRDGRTYMYFKGEPLYPFGFGLSYTTFRYSNLKTSTPSAAADGTVTVSVDVTNTGARTGDAVVQLYVKHLALEGRLAPTKSSRASSASPSSPTRPRPSRSRSRPRPWPTGTTNNPASTSKPNPSN